MSDVEISIVIPVRNEETQVCQVFEEIRRVLGGASFEIVFVDDGSSDDTWREIRALREEDARIRGVRLSRGFGKEAAIWAGIESARGAAVVVMDVDLQHPPALIPRMVELWQTGRWRIVEARRSSRGAEPFWYRGSSVLFYSLLRWGTGLDVQGATDFKLLDRDVVEVLKKLPERVTFFRGICSWTGVDRASIDFEVAPAQRPTRWNVLRLMRLGIDAITSFTPWPLFLVAVAGVVFALFSAVLGVQTLYMYFSGRAVTGFTTVILLILIVGAVITLALGILGLYVSRLFEEVKGRPRYIALERIAPEDGLSGAAEDRSRA